MGVTRDCPNRGDPTPAVPSRHSRASSSCALALAPAAEGCRDVVMPKTPAIGSLRGLLVVVRLLSCAPLRAEWKWDGKAGEVRWGRTGTPFGKGCGSRSNPMWVPTITSSTCEYFWSVAERWVFRWGPDSPWGQGSPSCCDLVGPRGRTPEAVMEATIEPNGEWLGPRRGL